MLPTLVSMVTSSGVTTVVRQFIRWWYALHANVIQPQNTIQEVVLVDSAQSYVSLMLNTLIARPHTHSAYGGSEEGKACECRQKEQSCGETLPADLSPGVHTRNYLCLGVYGWL